MQCLRCSCDLKEGTADFSLKVMLCSKCAAAVAKLRARMRSELEAVLGSLDETLRFALVDKRLPEGMDGETPRANCLKFIIEADEQCRNQSRTRSSRSSKQSATTADGRSSSDKPSVLG